MRRKMSTHDRASVAAGLRAPATDRPGDFSRALCSLVTNEKRVSKSPPLCPCPEAALHDRKRCTPGRGVWGRVRESEREKSIDNQEVTEGRKAQRPVG